MAFLSGSTKNLPQPEQRPLNIDARRASTNEQGRPVPWVLGQQRVGVTWLSQAFNQRADPVRQKVGKEKIVVGYNYFCDIAGLICHGKVEELHKIYFDDIEVWPKGGASLAIGAQPFTDFTVTVDGRATSWRIYWGTDDQDFDPELKKLSADPVRNPSGVVAPNVAEEHPAYIRQCYIRIKNHFLGYNRTSMQNVELVIARYHDVSWLGGTNGSVVLDDCGIPHVLHDAMTSETYGLGLKDVDATNTRFDRTGMEAVRATLATEKLGVSPVVSRVQPFDQTLRQALEYVDGFYTTTADGKFSLGLVREVPCNDASLPRFEEKDLVEPPRVRISGLAQTFNEVRVKFTNADNQYKEDAFPGDHLSNFQAREVAEPLVLDRPWCTRPAMADQLARVAAKVMGQPAQEGTIIVRKSRLQGLKAGGGFYLNYAHYGMCWLHCRATELRLPPYKPVVEIDWQVDRGYLETQTYSPPSYTSPGRIVHVPQQFSEAVALELPYDPVTSEAPLVTFLAPRPQSMIMRYNAYQVIGARNEFAETVEFFPWKATLDANYSDTASGTISVTLDGTDLTIPSEILSSEADANRLLALIGDEIMSLHTPSVVAANQYTFQTKRERFDSKKLSHTAGTRVWLVDIDSLRQNHFRADKQPHADGNQQTWKLAPILLNAEAALGSALQVNLTFTDRAKRPWKPRDFAGPSTFNGSTNLTFTWTENSREGRPFGRDNNGPKYIIEFRRTTDTSEYPLNNPRFKAEANPGNTSYVLKTSDIVNKIGLFSFIARIYMRQGGFNSRHHAELTLTYTP